MRLEVEVRDEDVSLIERFLAGTDDGANSHGKLDMKRLAEMLMEDVAAAVRRPGSWEGANMVQVLESHGYDI